MYLPATGLVDPAVEKDRLTKELAKVEKDLEQWESITTWLNGKAPAGKGEGKKSQNKAAEAKNGESKKG